MFNSPYINQFNQQQSLERINAQINDLERLKSQLQQPQQQPTNLTQNFQLAPTNRDVIKYANSLDEVQRDMVIGETPYFSKDMSVVWIKNTKGEIKTYELNEIIPKDAKDMQIEMLQAQIDELKKGMKKNEQFNSNVNAEQTTTDTEWNDEEDGTTTKDEKSSSIQRVSTSKKGK
jgi:prefoldin subunit 5